MDGSNTMHQDVSSSASEKSEGELLEAGIRRSLQLAPSNAAADRQRQCHCLDNADCICGQVFPPC